jgi:glucose-6-phosphate 1-dehydrogenase
MVAMEAPTEFESTEIRDRKVEVLKSVRRINPEDINHYTVRAQYTQEKLTDNKRGLSAGAGSESKLKY